MRLRRCVLGGLAVVCLAAAAFSCKKSIEESPKAPDGAKGDESAAITAFKISSPLETAGIIDRRTITVVVPAGTDITHVRAEATLSRKGAVAPDPREPLDYSGPRRFTVLSENGGQLSYTVIARPAAPGDCAISLFRINDTDGVIDHDARTVTITMPYGTSLDGLAPVVFHTGRALTPPSGLARDFSAGSARYTVTARDGGERAYDVRVRAALNPAKTLTAFRVTSPVRAEGAIDEAARRVTVLLPFGADTGAVTAEAGHTGVSARPDPAEAWDYALPRILTIQAEDGTKAEYEVAVRAEAGIERFAFTSPVAAPGAIDHAKRTIGISVPYATDLGAIRAEAIVSRGTLSPDAARVRDYAGPTRFTLEAEGEPALVYTVLASKVPPGSYAVTYEPNGATGGFIPQSRFVYDAGDPLPANAFTRAGRRFAGWNTRADGTGTPYADKAPARNLAPPDGLATLYAQWEPGEPSEHP